MMNDECRKDCKCLQEEIMSYELKTFVPRRKSLVRSTLPFDLCPLSFLFLNIFYFKHVYC